MELWAIAALWLVWRLWTVLSTPKEVLESILGQIPSLRPDLTVDQLSVSSAAVRWRYPAHAKHAAKHLVELFCESDGELKSFETERGQSRYILSDLKPRTHYRVQLYALPRRQLAAKINFQTLESAKEIAPITEWTQPHLHHAPMKSTSHEPQKSIDQVKREIKDLQSQVNDEFQLRREATKDFDAAEAKLKASLESVTASRRGEHAARDNQRAEVKMLETEKQDLDIKRKNKLKQHKELQHLLNVQHAAKNRWDKELSEQREFIEHKKQENAEKIAAVEAEEQFLVSSQQAVNRALEQLEADIRQKSQELKVAERSKDRSRNLIATLERHTDLTTGLLSSSFTKSEDYTPEERALIEDFEKDASVEDEWTTLQQVLEHQYVTAYQRFESANRALANAQARAHAQTKAQAQLYANAFTSGSSAHSRSPSSSVISNTPAVSDLLPSNLFKDDTLNAPPASAPAATPASRIMAPPSPGIPPGHSSSALNSQFKPWTSTRSRDSSIFFSAASSVHDSAADGQSFARGHSFDLAPLTPVAPVSAPSNPLMTPVDPDQKLSSLPSSPEKFKWRLGKKQTSNTASPQQPSTTSSFVRRLSFFRKDKPEEKIEEEMPL